MGHEKTRTPELHGGSILTWDPSELKPRQGPKVRPGLEASALTPRHSVGFTITYSLIHDT